MPLAQTDRTHQVVSWFIGIRTVCVVHSNFHNKFNERREVRLEFSRYNGKNLIGYWVTAAMKHDSSRGPVPGDKFIGRSNSRESP